MKKTMRLGFDWVFVGLFSLAVALTAVWWLLSTQSVPVNPGTAAAYLTVTGRGFDPSGSANYSATFRGLGPAGLVAVQATRAGAVDATRIVFRVPLFQGFEGAVEVDLGRCGAGAATACAPVAPEPGGSAAHPGTDVVTRLTFDAVLRQVSIQSVQRQAPLGPAAGSVVGAGVPCFPLGSSPVPCWGYAGVCVCVCVRACVRARCIGCVCVCV